MISFHSNVLALAFLFLLVSLLIESPSTPTNSSSLCHLPADSVERKCQETAYILLVLTLCFMGPSTQIVVAFPTHSLLISCAIETDFALASLLQEGSF